MPFLPADRGDKPGEVAAPALNPSVAGAVSSELSTDIALD
jgi:hypothetical protein